MIQDQKGRKKRTTYFDVRAEEEHITAARTKQHEDKEEDTGTRPAGRENKGTKRETRQKRNKTSKTTSVIAAAFALPPLNSTRQTKTTTHCNLASNHGIAFRLAGTRRIIGTPPFKICFLCCFCIMSASHHPVSSQSLICGSHGTTAVTHQALPVVTATDGASVGVRVCATLPVDLVNRNRHIISRGAINWMLLRGAGGYKPTLPRDFKNNRAATVPTTTTAAVQQQYNSIGA